MQQDDGEEPQIKDAPIEQAQAEPHDAETEDELEESAKEPQQESIDGDSKGSMTVDGGENEEEAPQYEEEGDIGQSALDQLSQVAEQKPDLDKKRIIEAALFLANKPLSPAELAVLAHCSVKEASRFLYALQNEYEEGQTALSIEVQMTEAKVNEARMQVKSAYLPAVSALSKEVELSRKGLKILGLIAKKGQILQSGLKNYFRGEIYAYVTELKDRGYIISEKKGNTRLLKPTRKFFEHFQAAQG